MTDQQSTIYLLIISRFIWKNEPARQSKKQWSISWNSWQQIYFI